MPAGEPAAAPETDGAPGRRRAASRHRSSWSGPLPPWLAWLLRSGLPLISLGPALLGTALVQGLAPVRLPDGVARFAIAGADLVLRPGALNGYPSAFTTPVFGWAGYGLLERLLLGGVGQSVLGAVRGSLLLIALASVALLWLLGRRLGASALAAGAAAAVLGMAPIAVAVHGAPAAADLAAPLLLAAALLLTVGRLRVMSPALAGALAGAAVLVEPVALAALPALTGLLVLRTRAAEARLRPRALAAGSGLVAVAGLGVLTLLVLGAALPAATGSAQLAALGAAAAAARPIPALGSASGALWLAEDPLSLLVVAVAVVVAATLPRGRLLAATAALVLAVSVWPLGAEPDAPPAIVLPVAALAVALVVDRAVVALGSPTFLVSLIGSGWLMGVAALLVVALGAWIAGLVGTGRDLGRQLVASSGWVRSGVPDGQVVLVDVAAWPDAERGGGPAVGWYAPPVGPGVVPSSAPWASASWVVADPALRASATGSAAAALRRTVPVRSFGSGDSAVQVRALPGSAPGGGGGPGGARPTPPPSPSSSVPLSPSASTSARASASPSPAPGSSAAARAAEARRQTGGQLAENPRIVLSAGDRALLRQGAVDSRIALVLGQLASQHSVTVSSFPSGSGDVPGVRRRVVIGAVDGVRVPGDPAQTGVLLRYLSALRPPYAPQSLDAHGDGVLVTFSGNPTFVPAP